MVVVNITSGLRDPQREYVSWTKIPDHIPQITLKVIDGALEQLANY